MILRNTPCGPIRGIPTAPGVTAYKGIRYAQAERWCYPQLITHWDGVYDATHYGPCAVQPYTFISEAEHARSPFFYHEFREGLNYQYSEDCLYLNIWAPNNAEKAPVIVYIHGGAFLGGASWDKVFDAPHWVQHGAIAVTLNYRLGLLGYACLPELEEESGHTGNYGLYDQLAALEWIHANIAAFGGDPENITLMGQSAGARSVQMLCSTTRTKSLVHRAVMSSGGGDDCALFEGDCLPKSRYPFWKKWMQETGAETLAQLRELPAKSLFDAMERCFQRYSFQEVMQNLGPVWDGADFPLSDFTLPIPYMAGATSEDLHESLTGDAFRWCKKQPVSSYAYYFNHPLPGDDKGAWHSADLWYWFGTLENCWRPFSESDRALSDMMIAYLLNFARHGDPNGEGLPVWVPADIHSTQLMCLNATAPGMGTPACANTGIFGW